MATAEHDGTISEIEYQMLRTGPPFHAPWSHLPWKSIDSFLTRSEVGIQQFDLQTKPLSHGRFKGLGKSMAEGWLQQAPILPSLVATRRRFGNSNQITDTFKIKALGYEMRCFTGGTGGKFDQSSKSDYRNHRRSSSIMPVSTSEAQSDNFLTRFKEVQKINVDSVWLCCKAVIPQMKENGKEESLIVAYSELLVLQTALYCKQRCGNPTYRPLFRTGRHRNYHQCDLPWPFRLNE